MANTLSGLKALETLRKAKGQNFIVGRAQKAGRASAAKRQLGREAFAEMGRKGAAVRWGKG